MPELRETAERRKDFISSESQDDQDPRETEEESLIHDAMREPSEFRDALANRVGDIFSYLIDRSDRYGVIYPFDVDRDQRIISLRDLTEARRLYLLLLACSALRYVGNADRTTLTSKFEIVCLEMLRRIFPAHAEVHLFGKNSLTSGKYKGLLFHKIKELAKDLGEECFARESEFEVGDTGDNGLDVVGWIPVADSLPGRVTVFGQAACTPEWISKQHSSSAAAWRSMIPFTVDPQNVVFIPYDYRNPEGGWYIRRHIQQSIVVDRHRLIHTLACGDDLETLNLDPAVSASLALGDLDRAVQQSRADL